MGTRTGGVEGNTLPALFVMYWAWQGSSRCVRIARRTGLSPGKVKNQKMAASSNTALYPSEMKKNGINQVL